MTTVTYVSIKIKKNYHAINHSTFKITGANRKNEIKMSIREMKRRMNPSILEKATYLGVDLANINNTCNKL